ncbi:hemolysin family protein [Caldimonas tepidiphila]|uniref:hemolysin family protein n=1 Tax=Caldimonas tepidiphila TaxID=2315841 RepID=UPI000E5A7D30|nr:hemolysin family protein [Caldimonas tepidiphila]
MEIALLVALILLNGAFAMSEIALVTARKARLQKRIDEGDPGAAAALEMGRDPTRFLSTVQIGITSISILNGIVGESALAGPLARWLTEHGLREPYAGYAGTGLVVVVITYASIVLGELVPKRLGQNNPEAVARLVARPIAWLAMLTQPFVRLLAGSTNALLGLLGANRSTAATVTEEEIHEVLAEGTSAGVIESHEHTMVRNLFRLDDRQISSLMVPRNDIVYLDADAPFELNLARIEQCDHARFPVMRGEPDNIIGVVNARRLLSQTARGQQPALDDKLEPPLYIPETLTGMELLDNFRASGAQMAFVIDEYGEVQGLVTLQDLIEAITGEFQPRNPATSWAVQREDGSWLLDGHIPVPELKDRLGLATVPEEERGRYQTLSGMLMLLTGRLPRLADTVEWEGWRFEIVDMDGRRIDKVMARRAGTDAVAGQAPAEAPAG